MDLCSTIAEQVAKVQATAEAIAQLDVLCAFAEVAVRNDYCMPEVDASGELIIREGGTPSSSRRSATLPLFRTTRS